ncbi:MAG TPA: helix-turn-helix transcriptional regulator [Desulfuromonadaceae bacterium]|jgi:transcriptional regulator with XRE-family HTH domain
MKTFAVSGISQSETKELALLGEYVKIARKRREMSLRDMAARMMVSVPTVMNLEKGSPAVSMGIFMRALSVLDIGKNLANELAPENDTIGMGIEIRRVKKIGEHNNKLKRNLDF